MNKLQLTRFPYSASLVEQVEWYWRRGIRASARKCKFCGTMVAMKSDQYYCDEECKIGKLKSDKKSYEQLDTELQQANDYIITLEKEIDRLKIIIDKLMP